MESLPIVNKDGSMGTYSVLSIRVRFKYYESEVSLRQFLFSPGILDGSYIIKGENPGDHAALFKIKANILPNVLGFVKNLSLKDVKSIGKHIINKVESESEDELSTLLGGDKEMEDSTLA